MLSEQYKKLYLEFYSKGLGPNCMASLTRTKSSVVEKFLRDNLTPRDKSNYNSRNLLDLKEEFRKRVGWIK